MWRWWTNHRGIALVFLLVMAVSACGGEDVLGMGDRQLDRCSLMSAEESEQWLGASLSEPASSEGIDGEPDPVTCLYQNEMASLLIQVYDGEEFFAEEGSPARTGETIEGLG